MRRALLACICAQVYQGSQDFRSKFVGAPFALNRMPAEEMLEGLTEHFNKWLPLLEKLLKRVGPSPFCCGITLSYVKAAQMHLK